MAHQVKWNKKVFDIFVSEAMLSDFEIQVLETRIKGWSIVKQCIEFSCSESTINRTVALLKQKYDNVQKHHPDELPPRRFSMKETWMDTH